MKSRLFEICINHIMPPEIRVVIPEPYVPYIPGNWNGFLVLAEAQNLSKVTNESYVNKLKSISKQERVFRLSGDAHIGVYPWDDGSLKLAIESAFEVEAKTTAVSNAVLWSQISDSGKNVNPSMELLDRSTKLWTELLPIIQPMHIITCGKIAHKVIDQLSDTVWSGGRTRLRLPARTAMSRISNMFREKDLLSRYHEVDAVIQKHPEWIEESYRQNKIFFACHAVSIANGDKP